MGRNYLGKAKDRACDTVIDGHFTLESQSNNSQIVIKLVQAPGAYNSQPQTLGVPNAALAVFDFTIESTARQRPV